MAKVRIGKLEDYMSPEDVGRLLQKFFMHLGCSSMVWNEKGELKFVDFVTPYCQEIYSRVPERCEEDRKKRFEKALRLKKPFLHRCFAGKLNYVIPLMVEDRNDVYFLGVAGG